MSIDIDNVMVVGIGMLLLGVFCAFVTMPRWCIKSISRHRLWRLRDRIVDDVIAGKLPAEHHAVRDLVRVIEWRIAHHRSLDLLHLLIWAGARREVPAPVRKELDRRLSLDGLSDDAAKRVGDYREDYMNVMTTAIMLGSWVGIATLLPSLVLVIVHGLLSERRQSRESRSFADGADEVVAATPLGRFSRQRISTVDELHECAPVHAVA